MKQRNFAVELLQKLFEGEVAVRSRKNVVQARPLADMLEQIVRRFAGPAVETEEGALQVLGDEARRDIDRELVKIVWNNVKIDWASRAHAPAHLGWLVKHVLRKHGYPPDEQEKATLAVRKQAALSGAWAG